MEQETLQFKIEGMTCASCAFHARKALEKLEGATEVDIDNWHKGNARILVDSPSVAKSDVALALDAVGYSMAELYQVPKSPA